MWSSLHVTSCYKKRWSQLFPKSSIKMCGTPKPPIISTEKSSFWLEFHEDLPLQTVSWKMTKPFEQANFFPVVFSTRDLLV